ARREVIRGAQSAGLIARQRVPAGLATSDLPGPRGPLRLSQPLPVRPGPFDPEAPAADRRARKSAYDALRGILRNFHERAVVQDVNGANVLAGQSGFIGN